MVFTFILNLNLNIEGNNKFMHFYCNCNCGFFFTLTHEQMNSFNFKTLNAQKNHFTVHFLMQRRRVILNMR